MKICLLAESATNPVLSSVLDTLAEHHTVTVSDPRAMAPALARSSFPRGDLADVYLLKSRSPEAQAVAHSAERAGALVVNGPSATGAALDRWAMATMLDLAGIPAPRTWAFPSLALMARDTLAQQFLPWPLVIKSRTSSRGDLVTLVRDLRGLLELVPEWGDEPVIAQEFIDNDGFDIKCWVIGGELSAARRPGALEVLDKTSDVALDPDQIPTEWSRVALGAGAALGLNLFGVDLLITDRGPVVIDVNAFPGFRGANDPAASMLRFLESQTAERLVAS